MMEAARTSETSVDNHFTRQYNPEDSSERIISSQNFFSSSVSRQNGISLEPTLLFCLILV
jgi:hypothetical protein